MLNDKLYRDHVEWDEEQEKQAKEKIAIQLQNPVPEEEKGKPDILLRR